MKRFIQFGERIKAENEAVRKAVMAEGAVSHYNHGPLPRWMRWLDKKLPKMEDNWRDSMFIEYLTDDKE